MAISLNELAHHSGEALDQIRNYPVNWSLASIYPGGWVLGFGRVH